MYFVYTLHYELLKKYSTIVYNIIYYLWNIKINTCT